MKFNAMRACAMLLALGLAACSGQAGQSVTPAANPGTLKPMDTYGGTNLLSGLLKLSLLDASPVLNGKTVAHLFIGVDEIDALANGTTYPIAQFGSPYVLDLLQYQNGNSLPMGQVSVPAQTYSQVRLVLNVASTQIAFADGSTMPVSFKTTSSQSSAHAANQTNTTTDATIAGAVDVTINTPFTVASGSTSSLAADFNVLESLTANANTVFIRPSMMVANGAGQINGSVVNQSGAPVQNAIVAAVGAGGAVANTDATDANGNFNLHAIQSGTYQLVIYNTYVNAAGQSISASGQSSTAASINGPTVTVTAGSSTSTGTLND
jgi:hypothetical protein